MMENTHANSFILNSKYKQPVQRLFEYWCEVIPNKNSKLNGGRILSDFPHNYHDKEIISQISEFVYPIPFNYSQLTHTFSFVMTGKDAKWTLGFCHYDNQSQSATVIITYLPWHDTFLKLVQILSELQKLNNNELKSFLNEIFEKGVPETSFEIYYNKGINSFLFKRPSLLEMPSLLKNYNLSLYYNFVDCKNMIQIFAAMLAERRIIFTSRQLARLSACVHAANDCLYPMIWQHIFIPILPAKMKDVLSAPMPYLIGVHTDILLTIRAEEIGDAVIIDCDTKLLQTPFDDKKTMPLDIVHKMKKQLRKAIKYRDYRISNVFFKVTTKLFGGYRSAIILQTNGKLLWDSETFIKSTTKHWQKYVRIVIATQLFQQFIDYRLQVISSGKGYQDEFSDSPNKIH